MGKMTELIAGNIIQDDFELIISEALKQNHLKIIIESLLGGDKWLG